MTPLRVLKLLFAVAVCVVLTTAGCTTSGSISRQSAASHAGFVKPANALLARPGVHRLPDGRTLVVGTLRYRDKNGGYWAIVPDPDRRGALPEPLATFTDTSSVDANLWPLDGQYVLIEGATSGGKPPSVDVDALRLVVDVVNPYPSNVFSKPGLYTLERGQTLAMGWLDHRGAAPLKGWVIMQASPEKTKHSGKVLAELTKLTQEDGKILASTEPGWYVEMEGSIVGTASLGPAFENFGTGFSSSGIGGLKTGTPPRWRRIERPGLKDLPSGRKRLVGVFDLDRWDVENVSDIVVVDEFPFAGGWGGRTAGIVDLRAVVSSLPRPLSRVYGAAEGRITWEEPNPNTMSSATKVPYMKVDSFSIVTTMDVGPGERYH